MTRAPWRPSDVGDAILGRSTRPTLPVVAAALGLEGKVDITELDGIKTVDDLFFIVLPTDDRLRAWIAVWPMRYKKEWSA